MSLTVYEYLKEELPDKTEEELQKIVYTLERIESRRRFQYLIKYGNDMDEAYKKLKELVEDRKEDALRKAKRETVENSYHLKGKTDEDN